VLVMCFCCINNFGFQETEKLLFYLCNLYFKVVMTYLECLCIKLICILFCVPQRCIVLIKTIMVVLCMFMYPLLGPYIAEKFKLVTFLIQSHGNLDENGV